MIEGDEARSMIERHGDIDNDSDWRCTSEIYPATQGTDKHKTLLDKYERLLDSYVKLTNMFLERMDEDGNNLRKPL